MRLEKKTIDQLQLFATALFAFADASKAQRRACACFIIRVVDGIPSIISSGLNGTPAGTDNQCDAPDLSYTYPHVIHAEINALRSLSGDLSDCVLLCTDSPCPECLTAIRETSGIRTIAYVRKYRLTEHLDAAQDFDFYHLDQNEVKVGLARASDRIDAVIATAPPADMA